MATRSAPGVQGMRLLSSVTAVTLLGAVPLHAQQEPSAPEPAGLFLSSEPLHITLEAPLETITNDRGQDGDEYPGVLVVGEGDQRHVVGVMIRTRGNSRLRKDICRFPPLRLKFAADEARGTPFAGLDKVKLVTHCQDGRDEYEQYVLREYLVYRIYNLMTDLSFQVRLARVTYVDADGKRDTTTNHAFLIEPEDVLARRTGWKNLSIPVIPPDAVEQQQLARLSVFQYLIGNLDWSAFMHQAGERECCHNGKPIGDYSGPIYIVPHDFDIAGIINTRYANRLFGPGERLGIRSVRQRLYRGSCAVEPYLGVVFEELNERREALYGLYELEGLGEKVVRDTRKYLDEFYDTINDAKKVKREFVDKCRDI